MIVPWIWSLFWTLLVEVPLATGLGRGARKFSPLHAVLVNLLTHPMAFWLYTSEIAGFWPVEACVVVVELVGYRLLSRTSWGRAAVMSLVCNGVTILISLLV